MAGRWLKRRRALEVTGRYKKGDDLSIIPPRSGLVQVCHEQIRKDLELYIR